MADSSNLSVNAVLTYFDIYLSSKLPESKGFKFFYVQSGSSAIIYVIWVFMDGRVEGKII